MHFRINYLACERQNRYGLGWIESSVFVQNKIFFIQFNQKNHPQIMKLKFKSLHIVKCGLHVTNQSIK